MNLVRYLANLGYGTRREVEQLVARRRITHADGSPAAQDGPWSHDDLRVDGEPLDAPPGSVVLLHKPAGFVTSTRDAGSLVYELLPPRFLRRSPVVAPVGRLDRDSSGLLLLTDDGALNHRLTSPRTHLPKRYLATLAEPLRGDEAALFSSGTLMLASETTPLRPALLEPAGTHGARVTLTEGRYHQVRRMFAAAGNHVQALHRESIGPIELDALPEGTWRLLTPAETETLRAAAVRKAP